MQRTARDDAMFEWLRVVRMADMETLRWALGGLSGAGSPVSLRKAQQWVARCKAVGLVDSARPTFRDGAIVWATHAAIGLVAPNLYRQTTRHEVAVAAVSARYLARGFTWRRDRKPANIRTDHQVDGVAVRGEHVELVEVELTPKTRSRYKQIMDNHAWRIEREGVTQVSYFCTADAARAVTGHADDHLFRTIRDRLQSVEAFDVRGKWIADEDAPWANSPTSVELDGARPGE